jgi:hypothetical protein
MVNYFKNAARTIFCAFKPDLSIVKAMASNTFQGFFSGLSLKSSCLAFARLLAENIYRINFPNNHLSPPILFLFLQDKKKTFEFQ